MVNNGARDDFRSSSMYENDSPDKKGKKDKAAMSKLSSSINYSRGSYFKLSIKEKPIDTAKRHTYMIREEDLGDDNTFATEMMGDNGSAAKLPTGLKKQMDELFFKMNPGKIELYDAAFGKQGIMGELAALIDKKVHDLLLNRINMKIIPTLEFKPRYIAD